VTKSIQFRDDLSAIVRVESSVTESPVRVSQWSEVRDLILAATGYIAEPETPLSPLKAILKQLTDYLDISAAEYMEDEERFFPEENGCHLRSVLSFISEQLELVLQPRTNRKYSDELRAIALELQTASSAAYGILKKHRVCILPTTRTLFNLSRDFRCVPGIDERQIALLVERCSHLVGYQRIFVCEVDEIYNDKKMELKGGTVRYIFPLRLCSSYLNDFG
jgi:hypothetical protein